MMKVREAFRVQKLVIQIISGANKCKYFRQTIKDYRFLTMTSLNILEELGYVKRYNGNLKQNLIIMVITLELN
jgi:hypothetical protein